jgi:hypothetical protein
MADTACSRSSPCNQIGKANIVCSLPATQALYLAGRIRIRFDAETENDSAVDSKAR